MFRVWIDWGNGYRDEVKCYAFDNEAECDAFVDGVQTAAKEFCIDDFRTFHSKEELDGAEFVD